MVCSSWCRPWTSTALTAHSLGRAVEEGLTYRFHASWSSVLQLLCVFFEACGRQAHPVMRKVTGAAAGPGQEVVLGLLEGHVSPLPLHFTPPLPGSTAGAQYCVPRKATGRNEKRAETTPQDRKSVV